ncbi:MAG: (2E,6E)-farnesyl diphosphate synthase [Dokdonella sp.]|nr:(2E,6E)-farnesyl diphosphate synthase [Dokdonella sp.]MCB1571519.1 (2E,6E)-farnesyl diphosphate synthase [Xanthomonadales bacterium]MCB1573619.1 (2E,6E)-farnesyl diphosphate synthase [Xanthomonadales bacterium]MCB1576507.1 (2E,6E)-farnesyl diphosphate synthase [Xanthomonadales bacterium]
MNPSKTAIELTPTLRAFAAHADTALARALPAVQQPPVELHRAMHYAVMGGGKRMRPLLVYATGSAFGAPLERLDACAVAVEIIHAYSLVHDDLPAMDDDDLRRGRPTCHIEFGEAMAILAGDALQALAFEVLANDSIAGIDARTRLEMLRVLGHACGSQGMAGGQALDLAAVGKILRVHDLERMHVHKTGALIRASVRLGALAAGCSDPSMLAALERYGHCIGLAFQIRDDILDVEGEVDRIGKTLGKDAAQSKPTYPAILGLHASSALLAELTEEAIGMLAPLGERGTDLRDLARFIAERES